MARSSKQKKKKMLTVWLTQAEIRRLAQRAVAERVTMSDMVRRFIAAPPDSPWLQALALAEQKFMADARLMNHLAGLSREPKKENMGRSDLEAILCIVESNRYTAGMDAQIFPEQRIIAEVVLGIPRDSWRERTTATITDSDSE
jgi:hypothetical protein